MEPKTFALIDTVVKIGLGALISGIIAWCINRSRYKHEIEVTKLKYKHDKGINEKKFAHDEKTTELKFGNEQKNSYRQTTIKMLENATENIDEYLRAVVSFLAGLQGHIIQHDIQPKESTIPFPKHLIEKYEIIKNNRSLANYAISKLIILKFDHIGNEMDILASTTDSIENQLFIEKEYPSSKEMEDIAKQFTSRRTYLYRLLQKAYDKVLNE